MIGILLSIMTMPLFSSLMQSAEERISGGGLNENDFAALIAVAMPLALMWFHMAKKSWEKIISVIFIPAGLIAIAYTKSRGGTIALLSFILYIITSIHNKEISHKLFLSILLSGIIGITLVLAPITYYERMENIEPSSSHGLSHRLDVWSAGVNMVFHNPLFGVGTGNFPLLINKYSKVFLSEDSRAAHNTFLSVTGELGVVGLLLFLWLLISNIKNLRTLSMSRFNYRKDRKIVYQGLLFSFAAYLIACLSLSMEVKKVLPILLAPPILLILDNKNSLSREITNIKYAEKSNNLPN